MKIIIRPEEQKDFPILYKLNELAFNQEDESILIEKIRQSEIYVPELCLLAELNQQIVGHIVFSTNQIKVKNTIYASLALAPMAVHPDFQNKGIGGELIKAAIGKAKKMDYLSINVLGHPNYYPKFGFKKSTFWNIKCPFDAPEEAFMFIELQINSLVGKEGTVVYPQIFYDCL